jgi:integrase
MMNTLCAKRQAVGCGVYSQPHTYAKHSLEAGVPIQALARLMGHEAVSRTFTVYGGWAREMGENTALLRENWAAGTNAAHDTAEGH